MFIVLGALLLCFILISITYTYKKIIFYLKFAYYYGMVMLVTLVVLPYLMFKPINVENQLVTAAGCWHISKVIGIKWTLRGAEMLSKDRTCVIVANHQSSLDIQGMIDILTVMRKMTAITKRELLFAGSFGIAMYLGGLTFINRSAGSQAKDSINEKMKELKKKNIKLWVFPEGTRRNTGEIHEFKKGAFHAAIHAQVPIVPIVFSSQRNFLDTEKKEFKSGEIIITALPEISTVGLTAADVDDLVKHTRMLMIKTYNETSIETVQN